MKIYNVRFGLATNSSSSHSMIFLNPAPKDNFDVWGDGFGWENFTLSAKQSKMAYLFAMLNMSLYDEPQYIKDFYFEHWLPDVTREYEYIDHQSNHYLPLAYNTNRIDPEFFGDVKRFFERRDLVILGGNDNSDGHPLASDAAFEWPIHRAGYTCRKDSHGFWVLFDPRDGTKVRFSFDNPGDKDFWPTKADTPELVDLKITDYCPYDCPFCYQGSTIKGLHADYSDITTILHALGELKVFEVAIGGGEPTLHPHFNDILRYAKDKGITPNFTTKNLTWLYNPHQRIPILESAGAFAYSVDTYSDIHKLAQALDDNGVDHSRCNIHMVMGTMDRLNFESMLRVAHEENLRVTLLGYKTDNRGSEYKPKDYDWWLEAIKRLRDNKVWVEVSIDTTLAAQYERQILKAGIPQYAFHTKEGKFSCYIDAVKGEMAPSSYGDVERATLVQVQNYAKKFVLDYRESVLSEDIKRHFRRF